MALPTLGLAIIARDEQQTLPRLLASCAGAFDEIALVDTGSGDATVARFQDWAASHPETVCHIGHFAWCDDFAAARNASVALLGTDWWCWADCDDVIHGACNLKALAWSAQVGTVGLSFPYVYDRSVGVLDRRERLIKSGAGRWQGRVHERVVVTQGARIVRAPAGSTSWEHYGDGSGRRPGAPHPRRRRDLRILEAEVREHPEDPRAVYCLAQTHRDLGRTGLAIELYERRAGMGGFDQEAYQARFEAALLRADSGDWARGVASLLAAWEMRPIRAEPLHELARRCRLREQYRSAHLFALRGLSIPQPEDGLALRTWVYRFGLLFELSIACYGVGDLERGLDACERLLGLDDLPEEIRLQTLATQASIRTSIA